MGFAYYFCENFSQWKRSSFHLRSDQELSQSSKLESLAFRLKAFKNANKVPAKTPILVVNVFRVNGAVLISETIGSHRDSMHLKHSSGTFLSTEAKCRASSLTAICHHVPWQALFTEALLLCIKEGCNCLD